MKYEPAKTILLISFAFCMVGSVPRLIGMVKTKPEYAQVVGYIDIAAISIFLLSLAWIVIAILYNAKQRTIET